MVYAHPRIKSLQRRNNSVSNALPQRKAEQRLLEQALVTGGSREYDLQHPICCGQLEKRAAELLLELGQKAAMDGCVPGHIKCLLEPACGGRLGLSCTLADRVERMPSGPWNAQNEMRQYRITLNVNLLIPAQIDPEDFFSKMERSFSAEC